MMKLLKMLFGRKPRNVRVRNLVYDMTESRQSPRAQEIDMMYRKERAAR